MGLERAIELIGLYYAKALTLKHVYNKTAWALYQVWKIADKEKKEDESTRGNI